MKTIQRAYSPQSKFLVSIKLMLLLVLTLGSFVAHGQIATSSFLADNEPGGSGQQIPTQKPVLESVSPRFSADVRKIPFYANAIEPGGSGQQVPKIPRNLEALQRSGTSASAVNFSLCNHFQSRCIDPGTVTPMVPEKKVDFQSGDYNRSRRTLQSHVEMVISFSEMEPGGGAPSIPRKVDEGPDNQIDANSEIFDFASIENHLEPGTVGPRPPKKVDAVSEFLG